MRSAILLALALGVSPGACVSSVGSRDDEDLKPPQGFVPPLVRPLRTNPAGSDRLGYGEGFYLPEVGAGRTWRWMGSRGQVRLLDDGTARKLRITGWLPLEFMKEPPTIRISVGGHAIDTFIPGKRDFDWEYLIRPQLLGSAPWVLLAIETNQTVHAPGDSRNLGVAIERVDWEPER